MKNFVKILSIIVFIAPLFLIVAGCKKKRNRHSGGAYVRVKVKINTNTQLIAETKDFAVYKIKDGRYILYVVNESNNVGITAILAPKKPKEQTKTKKK